MQLYSRILGEGPPLVILHGLFGMSDNWLTIGRELARHGFTVHLPDLRNHGQSPHQDTHRYPDMVDDLVQYFTRHDLDQAKLMGHSMGGKTAMIFALLYPELLHRLVVVDMAPSAYPPSASIFHRNLISAMRDLAIESATDRGPVRTSLEQRLGDPRLTAFLAKNIGRAKESGRLYWKCNLPVLERFLDHLHIGLAELAMHAPCPVTSLFIKGNTSDYYQPEHEKDRLFYFPDSTVAGIDDAGHWVHSEQPAKFVSLVLAFLEG